MKDEGKVQIPESMKMKDSTKYFEPPAWIPSFL